MEKNIKILAASILGTKAFQEGKPCVPCLDSDLMLLLKNVSYSAVPILQAWVDNWMMANLNNANNQLKNLKNLKNYDKHNNNQQPNKITNRRGCFNFEWF